jgi:hypothetical protein
MMSIRFNLRALVCSALLLSACSVDVDRSEEEDGSTDGDDDDFADDDEDHDDSHGDDEDDHDYPRGKTGPDASAGKKKKPDAGTSHGDAGHGATGHVTTDGGTRGASGGSARGIDMDGGLGLGPRAVSPRGPDSQAPDLGGGGDLGLPHGDGLHTNGGARPVVSEPVRTSSSSNASNPNVVPEQPTPERPDSVPNTPRSGSEQAPPPVVPPRASGDTPQVEISGTPDAGSHGDHEAHPPHVMPPPEPVVQPAGATTTDPACATLAGLQVGWAFVQANGCFDCHQAGGGAPAFRDADHVFEIRQLIDTRLRGLDPTKGQMPTTGSLPKDLTDRFQAWVKCNP